MYMPLDALLINLINFMNCPSLCKTTLSVIMASIFVGFFFFFFLQVWLGIIVRSFFEDLGGHSVNVNVCISCKKWWWSISSFILHFMLGLGG